MNKSLDYFQAFKIVEDTLKLLGSHEKFSEWMTSIKVQLWEGSFIDYVNSDPQYAKHGGKNLPKEGDDVFNKLLAATEDITTSVMAELNDDNERTGEWKIVIYYQNMPNTTPDNLENWLICEIINGVALTIVQRVNFETKELDEDLEEVAAYPVAGWIVSDVCPDNKWEQLHDILTANCKLHLADMELFQEDYDKAVAWVYSTL